MTMKKQSVESQVAALLAKAKQIKPQGRGLSTMRAEERVAVEAMCLQFRRGELPGWTRQFLYDFLAENVATFADCVKLTSFKEYLKRLDVNG